MDNGAGAHRARFLGDVERAIVQPPVAHRLFGLGDGEHLRVGRGVLEQFDLVERAGDDRPSRTMTAPTGTSSAP